MSVNLESLIAENAELRGMLEYSQGAAQRALDSELRMRGEVAALSMRLEDALKREDELVRLNDEWTAENAALTKRAAMGESLLEGARISERMAQERATALTKRCEALSEALLQARAAVMGCELAVIERRWRPAYLDEVHAAVVEAVSAIDAALESNDGRKP